MPIQVPGWLVRISSSLRARILLIFSLASIVPVVLVGVISSSVALKTIQEGSFEATAQVARQLAVNIGLRMGDAAKMLKIADSDAVIRFVNPWMQSEDRTYRAALDILDAFSLLRGTYEFADIVQGVYILGFNGNTMNEKVGRYSPLMDVRSAEAVRASLERPGETAFVSMDRSTFASAEDADADVISISRAIVRVSTHDILGAVVVNLDRSSIRFLCDAARLGETGGFTLLTPEGDLVFSEERLETPRGMGEAQLKEILLQDRGRFVFNGMGQAELIVWDTVPGARWKILGHVRLEEINDAARNIRRITAAAVVGIVLFMVVLFLFFTSALTRPLRSLEATISRAESGDRSARAEFRSLDDIGRLAKSFDLLMDRIGYLVAEGVREQAELEKMELKALQAQINPHFLYNTLDAIVWMAEAGKKAEIVEMTKNLSGFFRLSLSRGEDWISVEEEIAHVECYLSIQKIRYRDILNYRLDVEQDVRKRLVLKLILQPLVENAVYHGVKNRREGGLVTLLARATPGGGLEFVVEDTGAGMDDAVLEQLRYSLDSDRGPGELSVGYGLRNIRRRIALYYGGDAKLSIESQKGSGTTVRIVLPPGDRRAS